MHVKAIIYHTIHDILSSTILQNILKSVFLQNINPFSLVWKIYKTQAKPAAIQQRYSYGRNLYKSVVCGAGNFTKQKSELFENICKLYTTLIRPVAMGWLRLVGSLKVKVSNAKEPYKRDDILQKRPIILRSLLIVANPYHLNALGPYSTDNDWDADVGAITPKSSSTEYGP